MKGLVSSYTELVAQLEVRSLLRSVVQDPQTETVNYAASMKPITETYIILGTDVRTRVRTGIIGFLNEVMYELYPLFEINQSIREEERQTGQSAYKINTNYTAHNLWLWENHTRLTKFLVVSMILESLNLSSFGVLTPNWDDIPQALIRIPEMLTYARQYIFPLLRANYADTVRAIAKGPFGEDYLSLYTSKRPQ
jgi:hypothetical protein